MGRAVEGGGDPRGSVGPPRVGSRVVREHRSAAFAVSTDDVEAPSKLNTRRVAASLRDWGAGGPGAGGETVRLQRVAPLVARIFPTNNEEDILDAADRRPVDGGRQNFDWRVLDRDPALGTAGPLAHQRCAAQDIRARQRDDHRVRRTALVNIIASSRPFQRTPRVGLEVERAEAPQFLHVSLDLEPEED